MAGLVLRVSSSVAAPAGLSSSLPFVAFASRVSSLSFRRSSPFSDLGFRRFFSLAVPVDASGAGCSTPVVVFLFDLDSFFFLGGAASAGSGPSAWTTTSSFTVPVLTPSPWCFSLLVFFSFPSRLPLLRSPISKAPSSELERSASPTSALPFFAFFASAGVKTWLLFLFSFFVVFSSSSGSDTFFAFPARSTGKESLSAIAAFSPATVVNLAYRSGTLAFNFSTRPTKGEFFAPRDAMPRWNGLSESAEGPRGV
mmetsp:Transcript_28332/g.79983  ORF Transcript_28332/g.79983 Transcript_28332/m.79983 type:complete len:254 (-) Transcript_28332:127-888(-)